MVVADISGSVAAFARFTLMLVYAMQGQFSKVRSFVFIDGIDEVTDYFRGEEDIAQAIHRVNTEADVVWVDGHSDYGHAFEVFWERYGKGVGPKTTVLLLGDARNNYHASQAWVVKEMQHKARHVYWLNPEPRSYWNTGDSIVGEYGTHTDGVFECRNLRQLEAFVEKRTESERLGGRPIDTVAGFDHLRLLQKLALDCFVQIERCGGARERHTHRFQFLQRFCRVAAAFFAFGLTHAGPGAVEPVGAVGLEA